MKGICIATAIFLFIVSAGYFGTGAVREYIDRESGLIVERTLSANTIDQLALLSEVRLLISAGNIDEANIRLSEATDTLVHILEDNCKLPECQEAFRNYKRKQIAPVPRDPATTR